MSRRSLPQLYRDEFTGYNAARFQQDVMAGLTVAAVALPLALVEEAIRAFGQPVLVEVFRQHAIYCHSREDDPLLKNNLKGIRT